MNKIRFTLIALPIFFAPLLLGVHSARANEFVFEAENNSTNNTSSNCINNNEVNKNDFLNNPSSRFNLTCSRIKPEHQNNSRYNDLVSDFSEEESNASVALFGCDCPVCINALRQLRGLSSFNNS
jgi:hypothetical protein